MISKRLGRSSQLVLLLTFAALMVFSTIVRAQPPQKGEIPLSFLPSVPPVPPPIVLDDVLRTAPAIQKIPVIVQFQSALTEAEYAQLGRQIGAFALKHRYNIIPGMAAELTKGQINALSRMPIVRSIEYDNTVYAFLNSATYWFGTDDATYDFALTGSGITIAVIDTGIDAEHVDLDEGKVIGWKDYIKGRANPYDDNGHGTHVSSIAAGTGEGNPAYTGIALGASLVGVKVLDRRGSGKVSDVIAAIDWCVANKDIYGIRIINLSLGTGGSSDGTDSLSVACNNAVDAGIIVAASAGNSGPATYTVGSPAAAEKVITVGAMADVGEYGFYQAYFSGRGPTADGRIKPDVSAPGYIIMAAKAGSKTGYTEKSGTSMSSPFIAGVAALILEGEPPLSPAEVKLKIMTTSQDWAGLGADIDYGAGRLDGYKAISGSTSKPVVPVHSYTADSLPGTGTSDYWDINVTDTSYPIAVTLIMTDWVDNNYDFDVYLYDPSGSQVDSSLSVTRQETIDYQPTVTGTYELRVYSYSGNGAYFFDLSAGTGAPDTTPPTITNATGDTTGTTGESVTISATITDDTDVSSATIYYTPIDASETNTPMTEGLSDVWSGQLPCAPDKVGTITYYITASDASGNTARDPASGSYNIVVTDNDPPSTITDLTATAIAGGAIELTWSTATDNIGVDHYNVYRDTSAITDLTGKTAIATTPSGTTSYTDTATVDGTTYYYAVAGEDAAGNQAAVSNSPSATADATAPTISDVATSDVTTTSATITWTTDEASDSTVNYGIAKPPEQTALDATMVISHSVTLSGLTPGTTYYYEVQSKDAAGNIATDNNGEAYYSFTTQEGALVWSSGDLETGVWKEQGNPPGRNGHKAYSYDLPASVTNIENISVTIGVLSYNDSGSGATGDESPYLEVWTRRGGEDLHQIGTAQTPTGAGDYVFESTDAAVIADIVPGNTNEIDVWIKSLNKNRKAGTDVVEVDKVIVDIYYQGGAAAPELAQASNGETALLQNYKNPFNPETWIPYKLAKSAQVTIKIYNVTGQLVRTLSLGNKPAGIYVSKNKAAHWDGRNEYGEQVSSGVYFYVMEAGAFRATKKLTVLR